MVNRFIKKLLWFIALNLLLAILLLLVISIKGPNFRKTDENTEASLAAIPFNRQFDFTILGTSHAREFTRSGNKPAVESILNKRFWNLSKGFGHGGLISSITAWDLFNERNNHAKKLVYFLDPWTLCYSIWNEENYFLEEEPLKWDILNNAIKNNASIPTIANYIKSKFKPSYFMTKPLANQRNNKLSDTFNASKADKQMKIYYPEAINPKVLDKYEQLFLAFTNALHKKGIELIVIIPPTLLNKEPGFEPIWKFVNTIKTIKVFDHSNTIRSPIYYYDISHLNSNGIEYYTRNYLKPILAD